MNVANDQSTSIIKKNVDERSLVIKKLTAVSGRKAEDALMVVAGKEGDQSAIELIERLNAIELGQIIKKFDPSVPSTTAWLADPGKIASLLVIDPMDWEEITDEADILKIQNEALNLLATILLTIDNEERQLQILEEVAENEAAFFYLCFPFLGHDINMNNDDQSYLDRTPDDVVEVDHIDLDGLPINLTYRQLLFDLRILIENIAPELAERIKGMVGDQMDNDDPWQLLKMHIMELRQHALMKLQSTAQDQPDEEFEDMFEKPVQEPEKA